MGLVFFIRSKFIRNKYLANFSPKKLLAPYSSCLKIYRSSYFAAAGSEVCNTIGIGIGIAILLGIGIGIGIEIRKIKVLVLVLVLKIEE